MGTDGKPVPSSFRAEKLIVDDRERHSPALIGYYTSPSEIFHAEESPRFARAFFSPIRSLLSLHPAPVRIDVVDESDERDDKRQEEP
jgi:hypothetical protein